MCLKEGAFLTAREFNGAKLIEFYLHNDKIQFDYIYGVYLQKQSTFVWKIYDEWTIMKNILKIFCPSERAKAIERVGKAKTLHKGKLICVVRKNIQCITNEMWLFWSLEFELFYVFRRVINICELFHANEFYGPLRSWNSLWLAVRFAN